MSKSKKQEYKVVHRFKDTEDKKIYNVGDAYNHVGKSKERIEKLSSNKNKIGKILIKVQE